MGWRARSILLVAFGSKRRHFLAVRFPQLSDFQRARVRVMGNPYASLALIQSDEKVSGTEHLGFQELPAKTEEIQCPNSSYPAALPSH